MKTGEDTPLTVKHIQTERPLLNNRKRHIFGSTSKTMKQLHNDGDKTYVDTLYKFVTIVKHKYQLKCPTPLVICKISNEISNEQQYILSY